MEAFAATLASVNAGDDVVKVGVAVRGAASGGDGGAAASLRDERALLPLLRLDAKRFTFVRLQAKPRGRTDVIGRAQLALGATRDLVHELDVGQGDDEMPAEMLAALLGALDVVVAPLASAAAELAGAVGTRVLAFTPSLHTEHTVGAFLDGGKQQGGGGGKGAAHHHPWHANAAGGVELFAQAPAWSGDWAAPLAAIAKAVGSLSEDKDAGFDGLDDDFILG